MTSFNTEILREQLFQDMAFGPTHQVVDETDALVPVVEGTPGSIAYGAWPSVRLLSSKVQPIAVDGTLPTKAAYPFVQPLVLCYQSETQTQIQPLLDWLESQKGKAALQALSVITR